MQNAFEIFEGVLVAGGLVSMVADYVMTVKGLDRGMKEVGFINKFVVAKWGVNGLPLATFVEAVAYLALFGVWATLGDVYGAVFAGAFLVAETVNNIRSAKLLGSI
jgi:hypothetical protein